MLDLYHYTDKKNIPSIMEEGLLPYKKREASELINACLRTFPFASSLVRLRENATFFYAVPETDEEEWDEPNEGAAELSVWSEDLDPDSLFVLDWKYAEMIYQILRSNQKYKERDVPAEWDDLLETYALAYAQSKKKVDSYLDVSLYKTPEFLYTKPIPPSVIFLSPAFS